MIEYNGTDTGMSSETEKAAVCSDKTMGLAVMLSDTLALSPGDLRGGIYQCPIYDLTADGETFACEECGEWFILAVSVLIKLRLVPYIMMYHISAYYVMTINCIPIAFLIRKRLRKNKLLILQYQIINILILNFLKVSQSIPKHIIKVVQTLIVLKAQI